MKNQHIPFELLNDISKWVNKNASVSLADETGAELKKVNKIITDLRSISLEVPKDLLKRHHELEAKVSIPNEDKMMLYELADRLSLLSKEIKRRIENPGSGPKAPPKKLSVVLPDGRIICEKKAVDTFVETLRYMDLEKCAAIKDIIQLEHPVVSTVRNQYINRKKGSTKEIDGYFIEIHSSSDYKANLLRDYAQRLKIDIQVHCSD